MESGNSKTVEEWIHWIAMENENVLQTLRLSPSHSAALTWSDGFTSNASDPSNENESVTLCDAYEAIDTNLSVNSKHVQQICAPADYLDRCCSQDLEIQVLRNVNKKCCHQRELTSFFYRNYIRNKKLWSKLCKSGRYVV